MEQHPYWKEREWIEFCPIVKNKQFARPLLKFRQPFLSGFFKRPKIVKNEQKGRILTDNTRPLTTFTVRKFKKSAEKYPERQYRHL